ncbi:DDE-type integrase/transposase/recombinase [Chromobacterium violaceum]|uniref:Mu transposase C-terminal domain-containing protein n=1 Tax=Chromobacterium violaceum TaxID=536 RepID=UPI001B33913F|nr:DDE-type integrase/transposase/recombinase [Chromobacterium violaceum]MBP4049124.1 DDE-type integrase/transposase/recombinase [Chromobacterium violaceum]
MFNQQELEAFYLRQQLGIRARKAIERVRSNPPSRRVRSSAGNVACRFPSKKMECVIQAESHHNELGAIYLWERDPDVYEFYDQPDPIKLSYTAESRKISYMHTPDFFLISENFTGWVECKLESKLQSLAKKYPQRFQKINGEWVSPPGQAYAAQVGLGYALRSSQENNGVLIRNLKFLDDYFDAEAIKPSPSEYALIDQLFQLRSCYSLHELLLAEPHPLPDTIYKMIVEDELYMDLSVNLLSDHSHALVYRDYNTALLIQQQARSACQVHAISFEAGSKLLWKGQSWEVIHQEQDQLTLASSSGQLLPLAWESVQGLLDRCELQADAEAEQLSLNNQAFAKMSHHSRADLLNAKLRLDKLEGRSATSARSLRRYRHNYQQAKDLMGNGFVGLIDQTARKGNRTPRLSEDTVERMNAALREHYLNQNNAKLSTAYAMLLGQYVDEPDAAPSIKAFRKALKRICTKYEGKLIREGSKAAYNQKELVWTEATVFPPHGEHPFDIAHIDHTLIDLMSCELGPDSKPQRLWLSAMIDGYSRMVLAYYFSYGAPTAINTMMLIRQCVQRHHRLPGTIVMDGGKDFASTHVETLLASLYITKKTRPPHAPRFGATMEHLFGVLNQEIWHNLRGNTQLLRDPRSCSSSHDPRKLAVWNQEKVEEYFEKWLNEVYEVNQHTSLQASPRRVFDTGCVTSGTRAHKYIACDLAFLIHCLPQTKAKGHIIHAGRGIKHGNRYYWNNAFRQPEVQATKKIPVRYDPFDLSTVYAQINGKWLSCRSQDRVRYQEMSEHAIRHEALADHFLKVQTAEKRVEDAKRKADFYHEVHQVEAAQAEEHKKLATQEHVEEPTIPPLPILPSLHTLTVFGDF